MDWYCLHFGETNNKAMYYLTAAREWMDAHPSEIVIFWISRHGVHPSLPSLSPCALAVCAALGRVNV